MEGTRKLVILLLRRNIGRILLINRNVDILVTGLTPGELTTSTILLDILGGSVTGEMSVHFFLGHFVGKSLSIKNNMILIKR